MSIRSKEYLTFEDQLNEVLNSDGKLALPNVKLIEDPNEALLKVATYYKKPDKEPYRFRIQNFDPPLRGVQTHSVCYYPKFFLQTRGMGGRFDGSGIFLTANAGKASAFSFFMCEHMWDESGANHNRGWHPQVCTKCGFDASIDSGD